MSDITKRLRQPTWAHSGLQAPRLAEPRTTDDMREAAAEIERLRAALQEIEDKHESIMRDPPEWVNMSPDKLQWAREAWYGASLIARKALAPLKT